MCKVNFKTYVGSVRDEIFLLGVEYCDEYNVDFTDFRDEMYYDLPKLVFGFKKGITPKKCASLIFSFHVHPVIF
ncbi:MAG: hypothetical protein ACW980_22550 [Promethearchaeota archaeon]|jgi:hypothetical protein